MVFQCPCLGCYALAELCSYFFTRLTLKGTVLEYECHAVGLHIGRVDTES